MCYVVTTLDPEQGAFISSLSYTTKQLQPGNGKTGNGKTGNRAPNKETPIKKIIIIMVSWFWDKFSGFPKNQNNKKKLKKGILKNKAILINIKPYNAGLLER